MRSKERRPQTEWDLTRAQVKRDLESLYESIDRQVAIEALRQSFRHRIASFLGLSRHTISR
jgi:hypothetical protein